jgi:hypothetical protein
MHFFTYLQDIHQKQSLIKLFSSHKSHQQFLYCGIKVWVNRNFKKGLTA